MSIEAPLSVEGYRARILGLLPQPTFTSLTLNNLPSNLQGRVLAEDVSSPLALPSFDNSAMDGYAVRSADVTAQTTLPVLGTLGAGSTELTNVLPGSAIKIMTGAPVPPGADAVVPYEWTDRKTDSVTIDRAVVAGQHIRRMGEDINVGEVALRQGTVIGPRQWAVLAAIGRTEVAVYSRPRVAVLSTGAELQPLGEVLAPHALYDSNSVMLAASVTAAGADCVYAGQVTDSVEKFLTAVQGLDADLIVTSGGISMGDYDIVKEALLPQGGWFGSVAMQPGKPQGFCQLGDTTLIALPGNPVSAYVSFHQFVLPAIRHLQGRDTLPKLRGVRLGETVTSTPGRRRFLRGTVNGDTVVTTGGLGSHLLGGLASANCLIVIDEESGDVASGTEVAIYEFGEQ